MVAFRGIMQGGRARMLSGRAVNAAGGAPCCCGPGECYEDTAFTCSDPDTSCHCGARVRLVTKLTWRYVHADHGLKLHVQCRDFTGPGSATGTYTELRDLVLVPNPGASCGSIVESGLVRATNVGVLTESGEPYSQSFETTSTSVIESLGSYSDRQCCTSRADRLFEINLHNTMASRGLGIAWKIPPNRPDCLSGQPCRQSCTFIPPGFCNFRRGVFGFDIPIDPNVRCDAGVMIGFNDFFCDCDRPAGDCECPGFNAVVTLSEYDFELCYARTVLDECDGAGSLVEDDLETAPPGTVDPCTFGGGVPPPGSGRFAESFL